MMIVWKKAKVLPVLIKPLPSINQWIKTWEKSLGKILSDQLITHAQTIIYKYGIILAATPHPPTRSARGYRYPFNF